VNRFRTFIAESWSELKKVTWPTRDQVRSLTVLVFLVSAVVGLYITVADTVFDQIIRALSNAVG
jgi:preprotein translocase subunit SecE